MKLGILGAGQLGRMIALEAKRLGLDVVLYDPAEDACAAQVAHVVQGAWDDLGALQTFAQDCDAVTLEFENVPAETCQHIAQFAPMRPNPEALLVAQDRLQEKNLFARLGIATPAFWAVNTLPELREACAALGLPAVLKTRRFGYDGKGQAVLRHAQDVNAAWAELGQAQGGLILEAFVPFSRELSIVMARNAHGTRFYPLAQNHHAGGVLRLSVVGASTSGALQQDAQNMVGAIADALDYTGVLALELFQHNGALIANEIAPRVHNTGHWTQHGASTNQFEQHLRAVLGLPLGACDALAPACAMLNLIGQTPALPDMLGVPQANVHLYGKSPRTGRKLGHVNVLAQDHATLHATLEQMRDWPGVLLP